ncbi:GPW/gp25 family protein [Salinicola aestuarinus]|uniref:GPW/gp25 family protein n=1 Tax=Salinicola aestuarinus TaxID=1949082 RepID=UPI001FD961E3|nr:GPW/gp25 family protein [Salinicola aestuarinus]
MNRTTGGPLDSIEHIRQSIADILTTPIGSRLMRRDYGSLLPELVDQPLNGATALRAYSATVVALMRWEPRIRVQRVVRQVSTDRPGRLTLEMTAQRIDNGDSLTAEVTIGRES